MSHSTRAWFLAGLGALVAASALHMLALAGWGNPWGAIAHLTLFGWISGMIYAVSYHTMPVFSGRDFPKAWLAWLHLAVFVAGVALATLGLLARWQAAQLFGLACELTAGLLFMANTAALLRWGTPRAQRPPRPAIAGQEQIDRLAAGATRGAGLALPMALLLLLLARADLVAGSWLLAGEHLAALGWVLLMIVGVAYHLLPRFSGRALRGPGWVRLQLVLHQSMLLVLVPALGFGWNALFALSGLLMAAALALFAYTVWPALQPVVAQAAPIRFAFKEKTP